jgi:hypothetical protein
MSDTMNLVSLFLAWRSTDVPQRTATLDAFAHLRRCKTNTLRLCLPPDPETQTSSAFGYERRPDTTIPVPRRKEELATDAPAHTAIAIWTYCGRIRWISIFPREQLPDPSSLQCYVLEEGFVAICSAPDTMFLSSATHSKLWQGVLSSGV